MLTGIVMLYIIRQEDAHAIILDPAYIAPTARNMASKGVKSQLKAAKAALGKKDYQEAERICQVCVHT